MNALRVSLVFAFAFLSLPVASSAQNLLQFTFRGSCYETNEAGQVLTRRVTEKTFLKEIGEAAGMESSGWALVYHIGGNDLGDTIDVIETATGRVLDTFMGLYFGEDASLGRMVLKGATEQKRVDYIYTKQNSHSMGAAFVAKRQLESKKGTRTLINGEMHWVAAPQAGHGIRVYTGTFRTGKPVNEQ